MKAHSYPSFLELDIPPSSYEEARVHIIPVEMEKSVSYGGGAAKGPRAILEASLQLEAFDGRTVPGKAGLFTHRPLKCQAAEAAEDLEAIAAEVAGIIHKNGVPAILGGEHTVTIGALKPFVDNGTKFGVVQFDAHADLRDFYENNPLSHACVMRRVHEMNIPFVQIGIRSLSEEEHIFRQTQNIKSFDAANLYSGGIPSEILPRDFPAQIYITFDVDCFDASIMPATGTPEPGGLHWYQVMELLHKVAATRKICGFDVVELAPISGMPAPDFTVAKLVYKLIGLAVN
jgi:N1-aminopropylagmatine ureohydrolase